MRNGTGLATVAGDELAIAAGAKTLFPPNPATPLFVRLDGPKSETRVRTLRKTARMKLGAPLLNFVGAWRLGADDRVVVRRVGTHEYRVTPAWRPFTFIDLFAGIGGLRLGFEQTGGKCVFSSEIDPRARAAYQQAFGEEPAGDLTKIAAADVPDHDILLGGFPCQPFSIIGKRDGFADTRGTLFFEVERLIAAKRPVAVVLENVKQFRTHDGGRTAATCFAALRNLGYAVHHETLNALDFGLPQRRERVFIVAFRADVAFRWPEPNLEREPLAGLLENDDAVDQTLFASKHIQKARLARLAEQGGTAPRPGIWHQNRGGHIGAHPYSCALRANASYSYLLVNGVRRPSSLELFRLQGFPDGYPRPEKNSAARFLTGNAVAVPVAAALAAAVQRALHAGVPAAAAAAELFPA